MTRNDTKHTITRKDFATACGTTRPTLNKWIERDKDGIRKYVTPDGIDERILKAEPWATLCKQQKQTQPAAEPPVTDERDELRKQLDELRTENAILTERIKGLEAMNALQASELQRMTQLADQAQRLHLAQLQALPEPKKGFFERQREKREARRAARNAGQDQQTNE